MAPAVWTLTCDFVLGQERFPVAPRAQLAGLRSEVHEQRGLPLLDLAQPPVRLLAVPMCYHDGGNQQVYTVRDCVRI